MSGKKYENIYLRFSYIFCKKPLVSVQIMKNLNFCGGKNTYLQTHKQSLKNYKLTKIFFIIIKLFLL